jgi:hypothetical protein
VSRLGVDVCWGVPWGLGVSVSDREVLIALTEGQVAQVVREASGREHPASVLPELGEVDVVSELVFPLLGDESYSRSVLRAVLVLNGLPLDGSTRELTDVARDVGIAPGATYRYMQTWRAVGLVEQDPRSRRYRRTRIAGGGVGGWDGGGWC